MSWVALLVAAVVAVSLLYPRWIGDRAGFALMVPVLAYTSWAYLDWGVPRVETLAATVAVGLLAGAAALYIGLPISSPAPTRFLRNSLRGLGRVGARPGGPGLLLFQFGVTLYEELIWRVFLLSALIPFFPTSLAVLVSAALFWLVHGENRPLGWHSLEFFLFSVLLAVAYVVSGSLILVWMMHFSRNLLILAASLFDEPENATSTAGPGGAS